MLLKTLRSALLIIIAGWLILLTVFMVYTHHSDIPLFDASVSLNKRDVIPPFGTVPGRAAENRTRTDRLKSLENVELDNPKFDSIRTQLIMLQDQLKKVEVSNQPNTIEWKNDENQAKVEQNGANQAENNAPEELKQPQIIQQVGSKEENNLIFGGNQNLPKVQDTPVKREQDQNDDVSLNGFKDENVLGAAEHSATSQRLQREKEEKEAAFLQQMKQEELEKLMRINQQNENIVAAPVQRKPHSNPALRAPTPGVGLRVRMKAEQVKSEIPKPPQELAKKEEKNPSSSELLYNLLKGGLKIFEEVQEQELSSAELTKHIAKAGLSQQEGAKLKKEVNYREDLNKVTGFLWEAIRQPIVDDIKEDPFNKENLDFEENVCSSVFSSISVWGSGTGYISSKIASIAPHATILSLEIDPTLQDNHVLLQMKNAYPGEVMISNGLYDEVVEKLLSSLIFFRYQIIADISPLIHQVLPHEAQINLGHIISLAQTTIIVFPKEDHPLSQTYNLHSYFKTWENPRSLIEKAVDLLGLNVKISEIKHSKLNYQASVFRIDLNATYERAVVHCSPEDIFATEAKCSDPSDLKIIFNPPPLVTEETTDDEEEANQTDEEEEENHNRRNWWSKGDEENDKHQRSKSQKDRKMIPLHSSGSVDVMLVSKNITLPLGCAYTYFSALSHLNVHKKTAHSFFQLLLDDRSPILNTGIPWAASPTFWSLYSSQLVVSPFMLQWFEVMQTGKENLEKEKQEKEEEREREQIDAKTQEAEAEDNFVEQPRKHKPGYRANPVESNLKKEFPNADEQRDHTLITNQENLNLADGQSSEDQREEVDENPQVSKEITANKQGDVQEETGDENNNGQDEPKLTPNNAMLSLQDSVAKYLENNAALNDTERDLIMRKFKKVINTLDFIEQEGKLSGFELNIGIKYFNRLLEKDSSLISALNWLQIFLEKNFPEQGGGGSGRQLLSIRNSMRDRISRFPGDEEQEDEWQKAFDSMTEKRIRKFNADDPNDHKVERKVSKINPPAPEAKQIEIVFDVNILTRDQILEKKRENQFEAVWNPLYEIFNAIHRKNADSLVDESVSWMIYGDDVGLLSTKISALFPKDSIVSIHTIQSGALQHEKLRSMTRTTNSAINLWRPREKNVSVNFPFTLSKSFNRNTHIFRYQILPRINLFSLLVDASEKELPFLLEELISNAGTTYFPIPPVTASLALLEWLGSINPAYLHEKKPEILRNANADESAFTAWIQQQISQTTISSYARMRPLSSSTKRKVRNSRYHTHMLQIDNHFIERTITTSNFYPRPTVVFRLEGPDMSWENYATWEVRAQNRQWLHPLPNSAVPIQILRQCGLLHKDRASLIIPFMELNTGLTDPNLAPYNIYRSFNGSLVFADLSRVAQGLQPTGKLLDELEKAEAIASILLPHFPSDQFTFVVYNSGEGSLPMEVASLFPNSTVISLEGDEKLYKAHEQKTFDYHLFNDMVGHIRIDKQLLILLHRAPEFFQTQYLGDTIRMWRNLEGDYTDWKKDFAKMFTNFVKMAMQSFIEFPSAKVLSLAESIFFPPWDVFGEDEQVFNANAHPKPKWNNIENQLIKEFILKGEGVHNITAQFLPDIDAVHTYIRIVAKNITRTVRHHYLRPEDEYLEKHERKYEFHHEEGDTWMIRSEDHSRLTYDNFGISLICLLRLGISERTRERLYHQFINLDLYEDMAPWNIQVRGGRALYVDKDSMDRHYTAFSKYAYQIILAMMNYKRSLEDFNKCKGDQSVKYGVPLVGQCVGSDYRGPCKGVDNPVPCADGHCYPSFLQCLQALSANERAARLDMIDPDWALGLPPVLPADKQQKISSTEIVHFL